MKNNRGFTLVEILSSIVILGLLATVFFQFSIFSQKTTTGNQEKLITLNVAQGVLERIKYGDYSEVTNPPNYVTEINNYPKTYTIATCNNNGECPKRYQIEINNITYKIEIIVDKKVDSEMRLHPVEVWVFSNDNKTKSSVEGFVELWPDE